MRVANSILAAWPLSTWDGLAWRHACDLVLQPTLASASGSMRQPVAQLISGLQCRNAGATLNSINEVSRTTIGCLIQAIPAAVILNEVTSTRASALNGMIEVHGCGHRHFRQSERDFLQPLCGFIQHAKGRAVDRWRELGAEASTSTDSSDNRDLYDHPRGARAHDDHRRAGRDLKQASARLPPIFWRGFGERRRWRNGNTRTG